MRTSFIVQAIAVAFLGTAAQADDLKIALVYGKTGPLEAYGKQTETGLLHGAGIRHQRHHDARRSQDRCDREGRSGQAGPVQGGAWPRPIRTTRSISPSARHLPAVALAILPVAEEYKKVLLVEPAVADSITGEKWNSSISSAPGAIAPRTPSRMRLRSASRECTDATLAQDYAFGRDGVEAFKEALAKTGQRSLHEEYLPTTTTDFTAGGAAPVRRAQGQAGAQDHLGDLGRRRRPAQARRIWTSKRYGIETRDRRQYPAGDGRLQASPRHGRRDVLLLTTFRKTRSTTGWSPNTTSASTRRRISSPPAALPPVWPWSPPSPRPKSTDTEKLISAMEGMELRYAQGQDDFPQGRPSGAAEHVSLQGQGRPGVAWAVPEPVRETQDRRHEHSDPQQAVSQTCLLHDARLSAGHLRSP